MRPPVRSHCRREWRGGPETKVLDPGPASGRGRAPDAGPPALAPTGDVAKDGTERLDNALATAITSQPTSAPSTSDPPIRPRRRRWPLVAVASGVMLMTAAALWRSFAVPALVRFPTDVDQHPRYEGTFTLFVDPATALPLEHPLDRRTLDRPLGPGRPRREHRRTSSGPRDHRVCRRGKWTSRADPPVRDGSAHRCERR